MTNTHVRRGVGVAPARGYTGELPSSPFFATPLRDELHHADQWRGASTLASYSGPLETRHDASEDRRRNPINGRFFVLSNSARSLREENENDAPGRRRLCVAVMPHREHPHDTRNAPLPDPGSIGVSVSDFGRIGGWERSALVTPGGSPFGVGVARETGIVALLTYTNPTTTVTLRDPLTLAVLATVTLAGECVGVCYYDQVGWIVANVTDSKLYVYDSSLTLLGTVGSSGSGDDQFSSPYYMDTFVARDGIRTLAVGDFGNSRVAFLRIDGSPPGIVASSWTEIAITGSGAMGVDAKFQNVILATGYTSDRIYAISHNYPGTPTLIGTYGSTGTGAGELTDPRAITSDGVGSAWVVTTSAQTGTIARWQVLPVDGSLLSVTSTVKSDQPCEVSRVTDWRGVATTGTFSICLDLGGCLYVANRGDATVSGDWSCFVGWLSSQNGLYTVTTSIATTVDNLMDRRRGANLTSTIGANPYPISYTPPARTASGDDDEFALIEVAYRGLCLATLAVIEAPASVTDLADDNLDPVTGEQISVGAQVRNDNIGLLVASIAEGDTQRAGSTLESCTRAPAWQWPHPSGVACGDGTGAYVNMLGRFRARVKTRGLTSAQYAAPYVRPCLVVVRAAVGDSVRISAVSAPATYLTWTATATIGALAPIRLAVPTVIYPDDFDSMSLALSGPDDQVIVECLAADETTDTLQVATVALFEVAPL